MPISVCEFEFKAGAYLCRGFGLDLNSETKVTITMLRDTIIASALKSNQRSEQLPNRCCNGQLFTKQKQNQTEKKPEPTKKEKKVT